MNQEREEWADERGDRIRREWVRGLVIFAAGLMVGCVVTSGAIYAWIDLGFRK